jgi:hypothetical protein
VLSLEREHRPEVLINKSTSALVVYGSKISLLFLPIVPRYILRKVNAASSLKALAHTSIQLRFILLIS